MPRARTPTPMADATGTQEACRRTLYGLVLPLSLLSPSLLLCSRPPPWPSAITLEALPKPREEPRAPLPGAEGKSQGTELGNLQMVKVPPGDSNVPPRFQLFRHARWQHFSNFTAQKKERKKERACFLPSAGSSLAVLLTPACALRPRGGAFNSAAADPHRAKPSFPKPCACFSCAARISDGRFKKH